jgi:hypothetical protein
VKKYFPVLGATNIPVVLIAFPTFNLSKSNGTMVWMLTWEEDFWA